LVLPVVSEKTPPSITDLAAAAARFKNAAPSVFPANGATGVDVASVPYVEFNKNTFVTISSMYIQGDSTDPVMGEYISSVDSDIHPVWTIPLTLAANTTYTIKVVKSAVEQDAMELSSSCGTTMTDNAGVCESTFTTAP